MLTVFIRAILLYILVIFALRLMGKRQLGELQPTELVITILISNIASLPVEDPSIPMVMGAIPILVLVAFELIVSNISLKSKRFRQFISGSPVVVISEGKIIQQALHNLRFSIDDLMESLREQSIFNIEDVQYAIVETTGKVSILQKFDAQNTTPKMLHLNGESVNPPVIVISDGKLVQDSIQKYQISQSWLNMFIKKNGQSIQNVFLMTVDPQLHTYIIPKEEAKPK